MPRRGADRAPTPDRSGFFARWSELHEGIDPASVPFVRGWLSIVYVAARPMAVAGLAPTAVTALGLVVAAAVPLVTWAGGAWPVVAMLLVLVSGLLDSVDGAVAVMTARVSTWGALLDAVCDRLADAAYGVALWVLGAPTALVLAWVGLAFVAEYARARAQVLLDVALDVVTVGERPTRIIVTVFTLFAGGLVSSRADQAALIGAGVGTATAAVGFVQLMMAVRRRIRSAPVGASGPADELGHDGGRQADEREPAPRMGRAADQEQPGHG